jgi:hypothetical protein
MSKTVSIKPKPNQPESEASRLEMFVGANKPPSTEPPQRMKRLTFDIPADLHKRIRLACIEKEVDMAAELRCILQERFPA